MEVKLEIKQRKEDSYYIYELLELPELDDKAIEEARNSNPSFTLGIIDYENTAIYPPVAKIGAYVILEFMKGVERKKFVSIEDPVYENHEVEEGRQRAIKKVDEMACGIARRLEKETPALPDMQRYLQPAQYLLSSQSQS
jgi:hypothetical protein